MSVRLYEPQDIYRSLLLNSRQFDIEIRKSICFSALEVDPLAHSSYSSITICKKAVKNQIKFSEQVLRTLGTWGSQKPSFYHLLEYKPICKPTKEGLHP